MGRRATVPTIRLTEFQEKEGIFLTATQHRELLRLVKEHAGGGVANAAFGGFRVTPTGEANRYDLFPGCWVGIVGLPGLDIVIQPKLPIERLVYLICRGLGMDRPLAQPVGVRTADALLEVMAWGFAGQLTTAVRKGLLKGYVTEDQASHTVRGRIRLQDQLARRFGRMPPVEVRYDEYTEDIEENRLLKAAIERLRRLPLRHAEVREELASFAPVFAGVSWLAYEVRRLPQITYSRLNRHYREAVEVAKLILRSVSLEFPREGVRPSECGYGFLLDMNQVFEAFVYEALREELGLAEAEFPRGERARLLRLDCEGRIGLRPDLSWWDSGRCRFVGDVKYKRLSAGGYQQGDYYQLLAYLVASDVSDGLLIYAGGEAETLRHCVVNSDKTIHVATLELGGEIEDIHARVRQMANIIRRMGFASVGRGAA